LTGLHASHVIVGLIILVVLLLRSLRGDFTAKKHWAIQAGEMYWHFVDGVWVFVLTVVYLLPLIRWSKHISVGADVSRPRSEQLFNIQRYAGDLFSSHFLTIITE
jgi:acyl-coenzyme A synthetase/AMP-(fatty) acid ligase